MESYANPVQSTSNPRALSPMVTRCLPLSNPLESRFCVLAYTYICIYVYTCIILHQKERRECSSIVSSSVVVLLTPLYLSFSLRFSYCHSTHLSSSPSSSRLLHSFSFLLHFNSVCLSLSLFLFLKPFTSLNDFDPFGYGQFFFSPKPQVSKHAGRVLAGREGRINNLTDAGVEEYPIQ